MEQNYHKNTNPQAEVYRLILAATAGESKGEIELSWEPFSRTYTYILQKCSSFRKPLKWRYEDILEKSSYRLTNLKSNNVYWFRIAAVNSEGKSIWSRPVKLKVP